jgi:serine palmitoyltransferase
MLSVSLAFWLSMTKASDVISIQWWLKYILAEYEAHPGHIALEFLSIFGILYILFKEEDNGSDKDEDALTPKEEEIVIGHWKPQPLVPTDFTPPTEEQIIVESLASRTVRISGKNHSSRSVLNFSSHNYLGLCERTDILDGARKCIDKYGVGSCGPRGFYGSFDVHIALEKKIAEFMGAKYAILYSDQMACVSSVIAAFAKNGDIVFCDEACHYGIQVGLDLCRAKIQLFRHNDMDHLEELLAAVSSKTRGKVTNRRFIITEGIFQHRGDICPLDKVTELAKKHKFRIILDDSYGIGVLGATGRGTCEHFGLAPVKDVAVIVGSLDVTLASVGGFCVGDHDVVDHQRLTGAGYVYSASGPPFTSVAATMGFDIIDQECKTLLPKLRAKTARLHAGLAKQDGITVVSDKLSPLVHIRLGSAFEGREEKALADIRAYMMLKGVCIRVPKDVARYKHKQPIGLCIEVSAVHTEADIDKCLATLNTAIQTAV